MSDETTDPTTTPDAGQFDAHMVPHTRFNEVNEARKTAEAKATALAKELEALKGTQAQQAQTLEEKLATLTADFETQKAALAAERRQTARLHVAQSTGLPAFLMPLLEGEDAESMTASAQTLMGQLADFTKATTPPREAGITPRGNGAPTAAVTPAQLRDAQWVRENPDKVRAHFAPK